MDPLSPNDPLWKLLGQAEKVKPRPNFTQNVLRAARQTPQEKGWLARVREWLGTPRQMAFRGALAASAAVVAVLMVQSWSEPQSAGVAQVPVTKKAVSEVTVAVAAESTELAAAPEVETEWENMEKFDALLAVEDTSELTDREIHFLLY